MIPQALIDQAELELKGRDPQQLELFTGEHTPDGLDQHAPGAKLDAGKIRVSLVESGFARALAAVYKVGTDGANKYSPNGWMEVADGVARYDDAHGRHRLARHRGEKFDPKSKSRHRAHEVWNGLAALELELRAEEANNATR